ncbi:MAG: serine protease [Cohaesibacter sp.]|jgi:trypsin|nr:serine protease [Cohaesibacter sp.]
MKRQFFATLSVAFLVTQLTSLASAQQRFSCETTDGKVQSRIVGGQSANINDWPWQVLVRASKGSRAAYCGGSIISPKWILTAAHCVIDKSGKPMTSLGFKYRIVHGKNKPLKTKGMAVKKIIAHPNYNPRNFSNDIALIRLHQDIPGGAGRAIQLSSKKLDEVFARPLLCSTVTGWGAKAERQPVSSTLFRADIPLISFDRCNKAYPNSIGSKNICAGFEQGGIDSCQGDSGGPLVVRWGSSDRFIQVGVVSWGEGCARPGKPGVYTRVSKYISWIQQHTGK